MTINQSGSRKPKSCCLRVILLRGVIDDDLNLTNSVCAWFPLGLRCYTAFFSCEARAQSSSPIILPLPCFLISKTTTLHTSEWQKHRTTYLRLSQEGTSIGRCDYGKYKSKLRFPLVGCVSRRNLKTYQATSSLTQADSKTKKQKREWGQTQLIHIRLEKRSALFRNNT